MKLSGKTVVVTGGSGGIGLALARRFLVRDNTVIICSRGEEKLERVAAENPGLIPYLCNVADAGQREEFAHWVMEHYPMANVLVNNAGIQNRYAIGDASWEWDRMEEELAINLLAPIHLSHLFIPHLKGKEHAAIVNVSSDLAFNLPSRMPVYGATKAGLHAFSFTMGLQLSTFGVEVIEVLPTATNTDLGGTGVHTFGVDVDEFADAVFLDLEAGKKEIGFLDNLALSHRPRVEIEERARASFERSLKE